MKNLYLFLTLLFLVFLVSTTYGVEQVSSTTSCIGNFSDGGNDYGTYTISPTLCKSVEISIISHTNGTIKIYEGPNTSGTLIYNDLKIPQTINSTTSAVTIQFNNSNGAPNNEYSINWKGIFEVDNASTNMTCNGVKDGTAQVYPIGGTSPYSYAWDTTLTTRKIIGLRARNYSVTVTDVNSCKYLTTFTITEPPAIVLNTPTLSDYNSYGVSCNGVNDARITANPSGGTGTYTYLWSFGGQTNQTATGLSANTAYSVTVKDQNLCQKIGSGAGYTTKVAPSVLVLNSPTLSDYNGYGVKCSSSADATITAIPTGGTGTYTYLWSYGSQTGQTASGLSASTAYSVTVRDQNLCEQVGSGITYTTKSAPPAMILNPPTLSNFNGFGVHCNGDSDATITANPTGGTGTYTYVWNDGLGQTTQTATGLEASTAFTVTV